jgi:hypothetical protein
MLALLATSPSLRRSRAWLQDKLWSDSSQEKGAASLRQTIHRLKEAAGCGSDWLISESRHVALDPGRISVVIDPPVAVAGVFIEHPEFCEGLDIADPEFEDWIRDQRLAFEERLQEQVERGSARSGVIPPAALLGGLATPVATTSLRTPSEVASVFVASVNSDDRGVASLLRMFSSQIAMAVGRTGGARIHMEDEGATLRPGAIRLSIDGARLGAKLMLQARVSEQGTLKWSNSHLMPLGADETEGSTSLEGFVSEVTTAIMYHIGRSEVRDDRYGIRAGYRALLDLFSVDPSNLQKCETSFSATTEGPALSIHRAWRAQIRVISVVERVATDPQTAAGEAIELISQSLAEDPDNSIVNAVAADVAVRFQDSPLKAVHLAGLAVERDPFSPYTRSASSQALAWLGQQHEAHREALYALRLAVALPDQSWWLMRCCMTAVRCGLYADAVRYAQTAHELAPLFRPPLRFLAALRFHSGEEALAVDALLKLKALEPDFSLRLMESPDYPAHSLRVTELIRISRSGLL